MNIPECLLTKTGHDTFRTMDKMDQESIDRTLWRYRAPGGLTLPMARYGGYPTPY